MPSPAAGITAFVTECRALLVPTRPTLPVSSRRARRRRRADRRAPSPDRDRAPRPSRADAGSRDGERRRAARAPRSRRCRRPRAPRAATAIGNAIAHSDRRDRRLVHDRARSRPTRTPDRQREQREDHEHHARAGGDAAPPLNAGHREHVAEHRRDAEDVRAAVAVDARGRRRRRARPCRCRATKTSGAGLPAEEAEDVRRAGVARPLGGDVDARGGARRARRSGRSRAGRPRAPGVPPRRRCSSRVHSTANRGRPALPCGRILEE